MLAWKGFQTTTRITKNTAPKTIFTSLWLIFFLGLQWWNDGERAEKRFFLPSSSSSKLRESGTRLKIKVFFFFETNYVFCCYCFCACFFCTTIIYCDTAILLAFVLFTASLLISDVLFFYLQHVFYSISLAVKHSWLVINSVYSSFFLHRNSQRSLVGFVTILLLWETEN